jgi:hypothetical protein
MKSKFLHILIATFIASKVSVAQAVPAADENIPYLVTFGKDGGTKWGDDDFCQVFFFSIPKDFKDPVYFRIFDPDCGGKNDEENMGFSSLSRFTLYGGSGCITAEDARSIDPKGNFKSGTMLGTKTFGVDPKYDNNWYTFGPFNPGDGEYAPKYGGYIFKLVCEGLKGDDGNLYRYFMSTKPDKNLAVEGGNAFTYEYTFRLHSDPYQTSHIYPYVDDKVVYIVQSNFDWDSEGYIRLISVANAGEHLKTSGENSWVESKYSIREAERGKSLDIQFKKDPKNLVNNNNVVFHVKNQYGELLPFFTIPIGGVPRPQGEVSVKPIQKKK